MAGLVELRATAEHCRFCFDVLAWELGRSGTGSAPPARFPGRDLAAPLFVTWTKRAAGAAEYELAGCIGTFAEDLRVEDGLRQYALTAALRDSRFSPIRREDLTQLKVAVSLLVDFEEAAHPLDWEVGTHGVRIHFVDARGRERSATFLPEVAAEQGWDRMQTLEALVRKSGCREQVTEALLTQVKLTRYKSSKSSLTWHEYSR
jgi:uncharacterized protein (TIGR00296 family)